jgi:ligand-binding SRPBCC domain-containing protein
MALIELETTIAAPIEVVFDLARDIDFHQRSMTESREIAVDGRTKGRIGLGETVTWRARHLGRTWTLTTRIVEMDPPRSFVDEQAAGPFAWFRHDHQFEPVEGGTRMIDDWRHGLPLGPLGWLADRLIVGRHLRRQLEIRNAALKAEAEATAGRPGEAAVVGG